MWPIFSTDIFGSLALFGAQPDYASYSYQSPTDSGVSGWGDAFGYATPRSFFYGDGFDSVRSVVGGPANARDWVRRWDARYAASGGGIHYTPKPEKDAPEMPTGERMIGEWFRAEMGEYTDPKTGKIIDMNKALDSGERKALSEWGKDPARRGVIGSIKNLIGHIANQLRRGDEDAFRLFIGEAAVNRRAAQQTTTAGVSTEDLKRLTNLLQFGAHDPAQRDIIEAAGQFLQGHAPAGVDGAKADNRVASLLKMYAEAFGNGDAQAGMGEIRQMLLQLEDEVIDRVQGAGPLPVLSAASVSKALQGKGYSAEHMTSIAAAIIKAVNDKHLQPHQAWWMLATARSPKEENTQGHLPQETANRVAFDLLTAIRLSEKGYPFDPEARDPSNLRQRLAQAVPIRQGKEQWYDWTYLVSELDKGAALLQNDKGFAAWEDRKRRGGGGRRVVTPGPTPGAPSVPPPTAPAPGGGSRIPPPTP